MGHHDPTFEELVADIGGRLRPVLPEMPQEEFDALVHRIARVKARWRHAPDTPAASAPAVASRRSPPDRS